MAPSLAQDSSHLRLTPSHRLAGRGFTCSPMCQSHSLMPFSESSSVGHENPERPEPARPVRPAAPARPVGGKQAGPRSATSRRAGPPAGLSSGPLPQARDTQIGPVLAVGCRRNGCNRPRIRATVTSPSTFPIENVELRAKRKASRMHHDPSPTRGSGSESVTSLAHGPARPRPGPGGRDL